MHIQKGVTFRVYVTAADGRHSFSRKLQHQPGSFSKSFKLGTIKLTGFLYFFFAGNIPLAWVLWTLL